MIKLRSSLPEKKTKQACKTNNDFTGSLPVDKVIMLKRPAADLLGAEWLCFFCTSDVKIAVARMKTGNELHINTLTQMYTLD